jgi:DNA-binding IclR family transcriptional regulator
VAAVIFETAFHLMETLATSPRPASATSTDKALDVCEVLSRSPRGLSVSDVARAAHLPVSSAHRVLAVLKRRGYVRQDEETARYSLSLKMLDVMFRALGGSELRLHAYPLVRDYVLRTSRASESFRQLRRRVACAAVASKYRAQWPGISRP